MLKHASLVSLYLYTSISQCLLWNAGTDFDAYMWFYLLSSFLTRLTPILAAVIALVFAGVLIFTYSYKRKKNDITVLRHGAAVR